MHLCSEINALFVAWLDACSLCVHRDRAATKCNTHRTEQEQGSRKKLRGSSASTSCACARSREATARFDFCDMIDGQMVFDILSSSYQSSYKCKKKNQGDESNFCSLQFSRVCRLWSSYGQVVSVTTHIVQ